MVVDTLINTLYTDCNRRVACLMLNNLTKPIENRQKLAHHNGFIPAILHFIQANDKDTHICCLILLNLSHEQYAAFEGVPDFLKTMESLMSIYTPVAFTNNVKSVESEALKYTLGIMANIAVDKQNATRICNSSIPKHALTLLQNTPNALRRWTHNSMEDCCLRLLVRLAHHDMCLYYLSELDTDGVLYKDLDGKGGIHDMRARVIKARLDEWRLVGSAVRDNHID